MMIEAIVCTAALLVVAGACLAHVRAMGRRAAWCERLGFAVAFGGALGAAAEWWWPGLEEFRSDSVFVVGCGLIAVSMMRGHLRELLARARAWDGRERRQAGDPFIASRFEARD